MMTPLLTTPLFAFALCIVVHAGILMLFPKLHLLDFPTRFGFTRAPLPYPSGIAAVISFIVFFVALESPLSMQEIGLLVAIILLGISCFVDDRIQLPATIRLILQIVIALIIFATGSRIYTITHPLEFLTGTPFFKLDSWTIDVGYPIGSLPILSGIFTVLWLMLTVNALNWFDGIPGQVSVLSVIGFATIGILSYSDRVNQPELALLSFVLAGIALGCLLFEIPVQRVVLGDTGAMFFGLLLGTLTIYSGGKVATAFLVLGVPLVDSFFVIVHRLFLRQNILKGGGQHLHHRLLAKGWKPLPIIFLTAAIGLAFGVTALFLSTLGKMIAVALLFGCIGLLWLYSAPKRHSPEN